MGAWKWKRDAYGTGVRLLLLADGHLAVVEQPADGVVEGQELMVEGLPEDVGVMLEAHALLAHGLVGVAAVVAHLCAELGASGLEEVRLLRGRQVFMLADWETKGSWVE